jgi:hypothetical protein
MKKLIFLLTFLSLTCLAKEPKFHYKDCVRINHGFYFGCSGTVEDYMGIDAYQVQLYGCQGHDLLTTFYESDMELSAGCKK